MPRARILLFLAAAGVFCSGVFGIRRGFAQEEKTVQQWVEDLSASSVETRREAAYQLDRLGPAAKEAVPALIKALDDRDRQVWSLAIHALARIGPDAKAAVPDLIRGLERGGQITYRSAYALGRIGAPAYPAVLEALSAPSARLRAGAAEAMGWMVEPGDDVLAALLAAFDDEDETVRVKAAEACARLGERVVRDLVAAARDASAGGRAGIARALRALGPAARSVEAEAALKSIAADAEPEARRLAIDALRRMKAAPDTLLALSLEALADSDAGVRDTAAHALESLPAELVVPALLKLLDGDSGAGAPEAARLLGKIGPQAEGALPAMLRLLARSPDASKAEDLVRSLEHFGPALVPPGLEVFLEPGATEAGIAGVAELLASAGAAAAPLLGQALSRAERATRLGAALALSKMEAGACEPAAAALKRALEDPEAPVRAASARALAGLGTKAADAAPALERLAGDADPRARSAALLALSAIGARAETLLPKLLAALAAPEAELRATALGACARMGSEAASAVPAVIEALKDPVAEVRAAAAQALGACAAGAEPKAIEPLIAALDDASGSVRLGAIRALGGFGPASGAAAGKLAAFLKTEGDDGLAAAAALGGLGAGAAEARQALERGVAEAPGKLRVACLKALERLAGGYRQMLPVLVSALENSSQDLRREAMEALGAIGPDAEAAVPGLVRLAQEPYDRGIALDNLQKIGCRSKEILVGLLESPSRSLRAFAVENLGKLGPDAADAAPALRKLLEDEQDQRVRRGARAALERIRAPD